MATLTIDDKTARQIYPSSAPELKEILLKSFKPGFFSQNIEDRIKTFEDACEYNNTNPKAAKFIYGTRNQIYQERVAEIVKALNEGWEPNYDDSNEYKYSPVFWLDAPGFRFIYSDCDIVITDAAGGSRFAFKNRDLSDYAGTHFTREYEMWLMPIKENADTMAVNGGASSPKAFSGTIKEWEDYIIPRVGGFEDACRESGTNPLAEQFTSGTPDEIAYKKGKLVCDVLNGSFIGLMKDKVSSKWYAWMEKTDTGFRFFCSFYDFDFTYSAGGSRLRLCSARLAKHFAVSCCDMMAPYWWNE